MSNKTKPTANCYFHGSTLAKNLIRKQHTPDILDGIANLSSDEVFTPPP